MAIGVGYWRIGTSLAGLLLALNAEAGVRFAELGVQIKGVLQLSLGGWGTVLGIAWNGEGKSASADVEVGSSGVLLKLE